MKIQKRVNKTKWGTIVYYKEKNNFFKFALYYYDDDPKTVYLANVRVNENVRKNGYGNTILRFVFKYAKENNFENIILKVDKSSWVKSWYERNGFIDLNDADSNYIWMQKVVE